MKECKYCKRKDDGVIPFVQDERKCVECRNRLKREKYKNDLEYRKRVIEYNSNYRNQTENKIKFKKYYKEYSTNSKNKDRIKKIKLKYSKNNPHKINAHTALRRVKKLQRTVFNNDITNHNIKETYKLCAILNKHSKQTFNVDHIIPLQGRCVSGLHVTLNLQVIPSQINFYKNNSFNDKDIV